MVEMSSSFRPGFVPKTIRDFLDEVSSIADASEKMAKLDDFVLRLEVEIKKIDAFNRELPLCALLLNDAISALKESLASESAPPLSGESIPAKREFDESYDSDSDRKNWMKSVQLWHADDILEHVAEAENKRNENESRLADEDMLPNQAKWSEGKRSSSVISRSSENDESSSWPVRWNPRQLKRRRFWSPELHELFVDSLQKLGGAEDATPKQIRDLMQVDGLTNDQIKSHLQKYRLQTRRLSRKNQILSRPHSGFPRDPPQLAAL